MNPGVPWETEGTACCLLNTEQKLRGKTRLAQTYLVKPTEGVGSLTLKCADSHTREDRWDGSESQQTIIIYSPESLLSNLNLAEGPLFHGVALMVSLS